MNLFLRTLRFLVGTIAVFTIVVAPIGLTHAAGTGDIPCANGADHLPDGSCPADSTTGGTSQKAAGCSEDASKPGVLTHGQVTGGLNCYLSYLLKENMPYVMFIALVLIVWSGIEYMLAGAGWAQQAKAKERITGIITGIICYFLITYFVSLLTSGFTTIT